MQPSTLGVFLTVVGFYLTWYIVVLSGARGAYPAALVAILAYLGLQLANPRTRAEQWRAAKAGLLLGFLWENTAVLLGLITFPHSGLRLGWAPAWMVGLWPAFATTLRIFPRWLRTSSTNAAIAGAVFGPLSYFAGVQLGAAQFPDPVYSLAALAFAWAILLPILLGLLPMRQPSPVPHSGSLEAP